MKFQHLLKINQTYFEHMKNALTYSFTCQKASMFFFIHAFHPDKFVNDGSNTISHLNRIVNNNTKTDYIDSQNK